MISKLEISTVHANGDKDVNKYVKKKIGKLDEYMPKHARETAHAEVKLKETKIRNRKESTCDVIIYIPGETIKASETTVNMYAAIDIVEEKLKTQLKKYKDQNATTAKHGARRIRRALGKLVGRG